MSTATVDAPTLDEQLAAVRTEMTSILDRGKANGGTLEEAEQARFDELDSDFKALERKQAEEAEKRAADEAELQARQKRLDDLVRNYAPARVTSEPQVYREDGTTGSFFRDLWFSKQGHSDAAERLQRNNSMQARALTTTDGAVGEFVPPKWLLDEYIKLMRPGRPFADAVTQHVLPSGTDSVNIPKINTGTAVAMQSTQNTAVQQTDMTTTSISAGVSTLAGGQVLSLQLIEQSPLNVDRIVMADLVADYNRAIGSYVLNDATVGALKIAGTTSVAFTGTATGAAAAAKLYQLVAQTIGTINTTRYAPPTYIVMHPRRWYWLLGISDTQNRPLVVPNPVAYNPIASTNFENAPQGVVGTMLGLPVLIDNAIPINQGAGTNEDSIVICKADDLWLMEGTPRADAFAQTYAQNLSVFVRLYNYVAFTAKRYPAAVAIISGTNLNILT